LSRLIYFEKPIPGDYESNPFHPYNHCSLVECKYNISHYEAHVHFITGHGDKIKFVKDEYKDNPFHLYNHCYDNQCKYNNPTHQPHIHCGEGNLDIVKLIENPFNKKEFINANTR
jgi:hypothetical protein